MRIAIRSAAIVLTAFVAAVFLAITMTMTSAMAATALMVGGIAAGKLPDLVMSNVLGGRYSGYNRVNVEWPAQARPYTGPNDKTLGQSVTEGADALESQIRARITSDDVTVVGMSAGALVTDEVLRRLLANPLPKTGHTLTIMVVADSSRQNVINESQYNPVYDYTYQPPPVTPYDVTVVTGEYDGAADFPDRPWNLLALTNAMVGAFYVHIPVMFANLEGLDYTETRNSAGGLTRHYLVPTERLPLVQLIPFLAPIEGVLKGIVDSGYSRNDTQAVTNSGVSALTTETESHSSALAVDSSASSLSEPEGTRAEAGQRLTNTTKLAEAPAEETNRPATERVEALAQEDEELDPAAEKVTNGATDLTDGNNFSPTRNGKKRSFSKLEPSDETRDADGANQQVSSSVPSTSTTSTTTDDDPPGAKDKDPSSSTSSSGEGTTK